MSYVSLTVDLPEPSAEPAEALLHEQGALGLEVRDAEAPPMPGVRGPGKGEAILVAYFDSRAAASTARDELVHSFPAARAQIADVEDRDWSSEWKALIKSVQIGRLWVGPPWEADAAPKDKVRLIIEPKMAFGTGDHPTTSLCLAAVDAFMAAHPGASVLDVGTGTGVLAIAAKKLGAARVVGIDNDPTSVVLAKENAELNGTPELELSEKTLPHVPGRFDLVLANILANTLVELAPHLAPKVGARLVLAGVIAHQREQVESAYRALGFPPAAVTSQGEWIRLDFVRP